MKRISSNGSNNIYYMESDPPPIMGREWEAPDPYNVDDCLWFQKICITTCRGRGGVSERRVEYLNIPMNRIFPRLVNIYVGLTPPIYMI